MWVAFSAASNSLSMVAAFKSGLPERTLNIAASRATSTTADESPAAPSKSSMSQLPYWDGTIGCAGDLTLGLISSGMSPREGPRETQLVARLVRGLLSHEADCAACAFACERCEHELLQGRLEGRRARELGEDLAEKEVVVASVVRVLRVARTLAEHEGGREARDFFLGRGELATGRFRRLLEVPDGVLIEAGDALEEMP